MLPSSCTTILTPIRYANGHENENGLSCKHAHWYGTLTRQGVHVLMEMAVSIMSVEPSSLICSVLQLCCTSELELMRLPIIMWSGSTNNQLAVK